MDFPIILSEWSGSGQNNTYKWIKDDYKIKCQYNENKDIFKIKVIEGKGTVLFKETEDVRTPKKPNVFTMRKTTERIVNEKLKDMKNT